MPEVSYQKFISERADPRIIEDMTKAEKIGDKETYNRLRAELLKEFTKYENEFF